MSTTPPKRQRATTVTRRYGGMDAAERRRERQQKMIEAGVAVFGTRGFHLSTVRDICTEAGLTERYFYESFKTLGELFDAVYADLRSRLQQHIMAAIVAQGFAQPDAMKMGEATLRAWLSFLQDDPRRSRIMLIDAVSVSENGMRGAEVAVNEFAGMLSTFMTMLYPDLQRHGYDMEMMVAGLTGAIIFSAKTWTRSGFKLPLDEVLKHNMLLFRSLDAAYRAMPETARPRSKTRQ